MNYAVYDKRAFDTFFISDRDRHIAVQNTLMCTNIITRVFIFGNFPVYTKGTMSLCNSLTTRSCASFVLIKTALQAIEKNKELVKDIMLVIS